MRQILLFPLSGYINRIQAIASSAIMADQIGARLFVCWAPEQVTAATADEIFSEQFRNTFFISPQRAHELFGYTQSAVPKYLNKDQTNNCLLLAGSDLGEQHFMDELRSLLHGQDVPEHLILKAGGRFFLHEQDEPRASWEKRFRVSRQIFYQNMRLAPHIELAAQLAKSRHEPFIGLHLRYTDRAHQAPFESSIRQALLSASNSAHLVDVFIASDSAEEREKWFRKTERLGLRPWSIDHDSFDRTTEGSGCAALIDWRVLSKSDRIVYFAESSFAEEAAVASQGYETSIALAAHRVRSTLVRTSNLFAATVTYPRRHGWFN